MAQKKTTRRGGQSDHRKRSGRGKSKAHAAPGGAARFDLPALDTLALAASMDRVAKILARAVGEVARVHNATAGQMYIVAALSRAPDGLTAKHLASALAIRPGSLTGMLNTLERRAVIRRERVPGDGRQQNIVLIEGAQELVSALGEVDKAVGASLAGLDADDRSRLRQLSEETEAALRVERALPLVKGSRASNEDDAEASPAETASQATKAAKATEEVAAQKVAEPMATAEPAPAVSQPEAPPQYPDPKPDNRMPPPSREDDPGLARNLFSLSSRVLSAVDAQIRRRRDS